MRFLLLFYIIYLPNILAQVQFNEESILLGFDNSCYGIGTFGGGISFFDFDKDGWDDITVSSQEGEPVKFYKNINGYFSQIDFWN